MIKCNNCQTVHFDNEDCPNCKMLAYARIKDVEDQCSKHKKELEDRLNNEMQDPLGR